MGCSWYLIASWKHKIPPGDWLHSWGGGGCGNLNGLIVFIKDVEPMYISATSARHYPGRLLGGADAWEKLHRWIKEDVVVAVRHIDAKAIIGLPGALFRTVAEIDDAIARAKLPPPPPDQPCPERKPAKVTDRLWLWACDPARPSPVPMRVYGTDNSHYLITSRSFASKAAQIDFLKTYASAEFHCPALIRFDMVEPSDYNLPMGEASLIPHLCTANKTPGQDYQEKTQLSQAVQGLLKTWHAIVMATIGLQAMGVNTDALLGEIIKQVQSFIGNLVEEVKKYGEKYVIAYLSQYIKKLEWVLWLKEWYEKNKEDADEICVMAVAAEALQGKYTTKEALWAALDKCKLSAKACSCTPWVRAECVGMQRKFVRTCTPSKCQEELKWEYDETCAQYPPYPPPAPPPPSPRPTPWSWEAFWEVFLQALPWAIGVAVLIIFIAILTRPRGGPPLERKRVEMIHRRAR